MATRKRLAIVGASARAAAFSALRGGFEVVAADLFADADLASVTDATQVKDYPQGLHSWLAGADCDAWLYTGALENYPELVARMSATKVLLGNGHAQLRAVRDPLELAAAAADAGLHFPETRREAVGLPLDGSWLCKTYRGSGGSGVWRLTSAAAAERASRQQGCFQRLVEGESAAAVFVISMDEARLFGVTRQWVGAGEREWHYLGSIGPLAVRESIREQLALLGKMLRTKFKLRGLVGADVIIDGDRLWIIEINPRYSASVEVLERVRGVSAAAMHAAACDPHRWSDSRASTQSDALPSQDRIAAKQIVYAAREAQIAPAFFEWAIERAGQSEAAWLADIPRAGELIAANRPVLTAFASGDSQAACEQQLRNRIEEVERRLYGIGA